MIVFKTKEQRDEERKAHTDFTYCKSCYSCTDPCGRTTVAKYRKYLKEKGYDDPWDMDELESKDRKPSVQDNQATEYDSPREDDNQED